MSIARRIFRVAALALLAGSLCAGCARSTVGPATTAQAGPKETDPLEDAIQGLQRAKLPADYREALVRIERHLDGDPEGKQHIQSASDSLRKLQDRLGLDA